MAPPKVTNVHTVDLAPNAISCACFHPTNPNLFVIGCEDGWVYGCDRQSGTVAQFNDSMYKTRDGQTRSHDNTVWRVEYDTKGTTVVSTSAGGSGYPGSVKTWSPSGTLKLVVDSIPGVSINSARFNKNSDRLVVAYDSGAVKLFSLADGTLVRDLNYKPGGMKNQSRAWNACFATANSQDDVIIVVQNNGHTPIHNNNGGGGGIIDVHNGSPDGAPPDEDKRAIDVSVSADGKYFAVTHQYYKPQIVDSGGKAKKLNCKISARRVCIGENRLILSGFTNSGSAIAECWDVSNPGNQGRILDSSIDAKFPVRNAAISSDGLRAVTVHEPESTSSCRAFAWNLQDSDALTPTPILTGAGATAHTMVITDVRFHPGKTSPYTVVTTSWDGTAKLWEIS